MKKYQLAMAIGLAIFTSNVAQADGHSVYADFPVTVEGYTGSKTHSVSYGGQVARHLLHTSLKKMAGSGDGSTNEALKAKLTVYYTGKDAGRSIVAPTSKDGFSLKQTKIDELSKGKNLSSKAYKGLVSGWPGNMTGDEVLAFMLDKAASTEKGYDSILAYDYVQLFSKTAMGAVFYNQAVDNYLDELLAANKKPNDKPYSEGAAYTGKEHVWDEAFGYYGAPANAMTLDAKTLYSIAKADKKVMKSADANGDGKVDLKSEMTFGHAYYAADADKSGKTQYMNTIMKAFIDGRHVISKAKGEKLSSAQLGALENHAKTIKLNWEKVIAEAAFKYAGSVYKDLKTLKKTNDGAEILKQSRNYAKHWGELKGFALALQMGGKDLGETAVKLNRLIGFSPVSFTGDQVTGVAEDGHYIVENTIDMGEYMVHMAKTQAVLKDAFGLQALKNEITDDMAVLSAKLGEKKSAEND